MRKTAGTIVGVVGILAAVAITAGVARYGFLTSDTAIDGVIWATAFGIVALVALGGPALAILLGRLGAGWGTAAWLIAIGAFAINCSNSLGAISGRSDKTIAERTKTVSAAKDDRAELRRLEAERAAMSSFAPTTLDAAQASQSAVQAAERARAAECGNGDERQRGRNCRAYEATEQAKRDALARVLADKAATDRAAKLESTAAALKAKIEKAPAVQDVNPQSAALARIFRIEDAATASSMQQMAMVTFVELAIAFMLAASEKLLQRTELPKPAREEIEAPANVVALIQPQQPGSVEKFMLACVGRAKGSSLSWAELYSRYRRWCSDNELTAVPANQFGKRLDALRADGVLRVKAKGNDVYCVDVKLVA